MSKTMAVGADPKLPPGTNYARCCACGEYFKSPSSFEKHRRDGRCLSAAEMTERGMLVNARGYWVSSQFDREIPGRGDE